MARTPSKRELLRPWELLAGAFLLALFVGVIVLFGTRNWSYAGIALGGVFIIALMGLSMFSLAIRPDSDELADIAVLDREQHLQRQRRLAQSEASAEAQPESETEAEGNGGDEAKRD